MIDRFLRAAFVVLAMGLVAIAVLGLVGCGRTGGGPIRCVGANCDG